MVTCEQALNDFHELNEKKIFASSAQVVFLHLLYLSQKEQCLGTSESFQVTDRELELRTGLAKQTITNAKRTLKNRDVIDFESNRDKPANGTSYKILVGQTDGNRVGQAQGQNPSGNPVFAIRENAGAIKELGQSKEKSERVFPQTPFPKEKRERDNNKPRAHTREKIKTLDDVKTFDDFLEFWELAGGCKLNRLLVSKLDSLLKDHSLSKMKDALDRANESTNNTHFGFSFEYFKNVLTNKKERRNNNDKNTGEYKLPRIDNEFEEELSEIKL